LYHFLEKGEEHVEEEKNPAQSTVGKCVSGFFVAARRKMGGKKSPEGTIELSKSHLQGEFH